MIWTQWLFIAVVLVAGAALAGLVYKNPGRYIGKVYTNPLILIMLGAGAVIVFAWFAGQHTALEKAAFGLGSFLAVRYFAIAMDFAEMFNPKPGVVVTRLDVNMIVTFLSAFAILAGLLNFVGVQKFADSAVEALVAAVGAGMLSVIEVYKNKDRGPIAPVSGP